MSNASARVCRATVLFVDVTGFAALADRHGPDEAYAVVSRCVELIDQVVRRHVGALDKYLGDSLLAVFGVSVALPSHELAALRAADEVRRVVRAFRHDFYPEAPLDVKIGVNTGTILAAVPQGDLRREIDVLGDAVNVAHRLEKLSRPGETLVSEAVQRHVRGAVRLDFEGERQLSGRLEPVHVYSVDIESTNSRSLS